MLRISISLTTVSEIFIQIGQLFKELRKISKVNVFSEPKNYICVLRSPSPT